MGQAKNRGDAAKRKDEAMAAGRIKAPTVRTFHSAPAFTVSGHEPTLQQQLMDRIRSDFPASNKIHHLSPGAERFPAEIPTDPSTQGDTLS